MGQALPGFAARPKRRSGGRLDRALRGGAVPICRFGRAVAFGRGDQNGRRSETHRTWAMSRGSRGTPPVLGEVVARTKAAGGVRSGAGSPGSPSGQAVGEVYRGRCRAAEG